MNFVIGDYYIDGQNSEHQYVGRFNPQFEGDAPHVFACYKQLSTRFDDGSFDKNQKTKHDIIKRVNPKQIITGYVNIYPKNQISQVFKDKDEANLNSTSNRIGCTEIWLQYREGDF